MRDFLDEFNEKMKVETRIIVIKKKMMGTIMMNGDGVKTMMLEVGMRIGRGKLISKALMNLHCGGAPWDVALSF